VLLLLLLLLLFLALAFAVVVDVAAVTGSVACLRANTSRII